MNLLHVFSNFTSVFELIGGEKLPSNTDFTFRDEPKSLIVSHVYGKYKVHQQTTSAEEFGAMNVFDYDMIPSTSNDYIWCVYAWIAKCPDNEDAKFNSMMKLMSSCQISKLYYQNVRIANTHVMFVRLL